MRKLLVAPALFTLLFAMRANAGTLSEYFLDIAEKAGFGQTIAIPPGHKFLIDGAATPVFGNAVCPGEGDMRVWWVGGHAPIGSGSSCIVIEKESKAVLAQFKQGHDLAVERWTVEHPARGQTVLRRPNGSYIAEAR